MSSAIERWRPITMVLVAVVAGVTLVSSCGAPHPGISNGSVSACYRALPAARAALHDDKASVIGVHRVPADRVKPHLPAAAQTMLVGDDDLSVCVVSFKGSFGPGQVDLAPPNEQGKYAVVLVGTRSLKVITSAVLTHLPPDLGKRTL